MHFLLLKESLKKHPEIKKIKSATPWNPIAFSSCSSLLTLRPLRFLSLSLIAAMRCDEATNNIGAPPVLIALAAVLFVARCNSWKIHSRCTRRGASPDTISLASRELTIKYDGVEMFVSSLAVIEPFLLSCHFRGGPPRGVKTQASCYLVMGNMKFELR